MKPNETTHADKMRAAGDEVFAGWLESPGTKMLISLVPPGDHPDLLMSLLRDAFNIGQMSGASVVTLDLARAVFAVRKEPGK